MFCFCKNSPPPPNTDHGYHWKFCVWRFSVHECRASWGAQEVWRSLGVSVSADEREGFSLTLRLGMKTGLSNTWPPVHWVVCSVKTRGCCRVSECVITGAESITYLDFVGFDTREQLRVFIPVLWCRCSEAMLPSVGAETTHRRLAALQSLCCKEGPSVRSILA